MISMFVRKISNLFLCHRAKEPMHHPIFWVMFIFMQERYPFLPFRFDITIACYDKVFTCLCITYHRAVIFQNILQHFFTQQTANKYVFVLLLSQIRFFCNRAMFQHLIHIHFAPYGAAFLIQWIDPADQFIPCWSIQNCFHDIVYSICERENQLPESSTNNAS